MQQRRAGLVMIAVVASAALWDRKSIARYMRIRRM
jgi:hypothetical protein